jgi:hypothetical protein
MSQSRGTSVTIPGGLGSGTDSFGVPSGFGVDMSAEGVDQLGLVSDIVSRVDTRNRVGRPVAGAPVARQGGRRAAQPGRDFTLGHQLGPTTGHPQETRLESISPWSASTYLRHLDSESAFRAGSARTFCSVRFQPASELIQRGYAGVERTISWAGGDRHGGQSRRVLQ